jgi:hypothetical protein
MRQSLEKWWQSLKGTPWEVPIEISQRQSHEPTKEALEESPWIRHNPTRKWVQEFIRKEKSHLGLMSVHAMRKAMTPMKKNTEKDTKQNTTRIKHMKSMGVRLENHLATLVMCREQPESINLMFSNLTSNTYIGWEEVDGSMLGLVGSILGIQHLTIWPEEVFTVFCTSVFEPRDENHDGENMDQPDVSAQGENRHL